MKKNSNVHLLKTLRFIIKFCMNVLLQLHLTNNVYVYYKCIHTLGGFTQTHVYAIKTYM